jgi:hypothetical protein
MKENAPNSPYRLTTAGDLQRAGYTSANRPTITWDRSRVPDALHPLIPLAEKWGIADDVIREDVLRQASASELEQLRMTVQEHDDVLDEWLAGSEALSRSPTPEYVAFSAMRMAVDFL